MSLLKGNYDLKKKVDAKKDASENSLEDKFEKESISPLKNKISFLFPSPNLSVLMK